MGRKLSLDPDSLAVESFRTDETAGERGTVEAREGDCTAGDTCKCPTSLYQCGTLPYTRYSCPRTSLC